MTVQDIKRVAITAEVKVSKSHRPNRSIVHVINSEKKSEKEERKMKISGFAQMRNEKEKGNLENWFKCMEQVCDNIFIYQGHVTSISLSQIIMDYLMKYTLKNYNI